MINQFILVWYYLRFYKFKTAVFLISTTLIIFLFIATNWLIYCFDNQLNARAVSTPLVIGPKQSRFDLVMNALYFKTKADNILRTSEIDKITFSGYGVPIPLFIKFTVRKKYPIVGTTLDYFSFRGLKIVKGNHLSLLGDCVIGSNVAKSLMLKPGDTLFSDSLNIFNIAEDYPLKMYVRGVLKSSGTFDDDAVFVDLKTAWIIAGIGHGHNDLKDINNNSILEKVNNNIVANAALVKYQEITTKNISTFHFHEKHDNLPLSAIIVEPHDKKSLTLLKSRYSKHNVIQALVPEAVINDVMHVIYKARRFINANNVLVACSTVLLLVLIALLSLKLRKNEMDTMFLIGCNRGTIFTLQAIEFSIIFFSSLLLAITFSFVLLKLADNIFITINL